LTFNAGMNQITRRTFLQRSIATTATASFLTERSSVAASSRAPGIIDTNVNLFDWPFRALKYRNTKALVAKLKKHRVIQAWAGNFEALLAKDMNGVNERLTAECHRHGRGFLIPFGSVNIAWPDWEEDLRRCHEVHHVPGIRIYPGYQPFDLNHPEMEKLVRSIAERRLVLQIVLGMEDPRVYHPIINVGPVTFSPLAKLAAAHPDAKIQLLHFPNSPQGADFAEFIKQRNTCVEISRFEGNGAIGRMIGGVQGLPSLHVPVERILFGSHAPYFPVETAILKLIESPLDGSQLRSITHENAERLIAV
jgi:predicted TIM-barrel fold metal-dependent hydrolase